MSRASRVANKIGLPRSRIEGYTVRKPEQTLKS